jgi:hypothetical protein
VRDLTGAGVVRLREDPELREKIGPYTFDDMLLELAFPQGVRRARRRAVALRVETYFLGARRNVAINFTDSRYGEISRITACSFSGNDDALVTLPAGLSSDPGTC